MIGRFRFKGRDIAGDIKRKYGFSGDILGIYAGNTGPVVHKWHHYIPLYERYFGILRGRPVRFLEIGVSKGGSLQMWRKYLGDDAVIFGIDIDPFCARFNGEAAEVRIGSQEDAVFLAEVVAEMGGLDAVLDDGSHHMDHVSRTVEILIPMMSEGGIYMIEDLHTAYWPSHGGGPDKRSNFFLYLSRLIHDLHKWYHKPLKPITAISGMVTGIHIHDSLVVLEKGVAVRPVHSTVGTKS